MKQAETPKEKLLSWAEKIADEKKIKVENFNTSWVDGKVFAALLFKFLCKPSVPFEEIMKFGDKARLDFVFKAFHDELGVQTLMNANEVGRDGKCLVLYVFLVHKASLNPRPSKQLSAVNVVMPTQRQALKSQSSNDTEKALKEENEKLKATLDEMARNNRIFLKSLRKAIVTTKTRCDDKNFIEAQKLYHEASFGLAKHVSNEDKLAVEFSSLFLKISEGLKQKGALNNQQLDNLVNNQSRSFCNDSSFGGMFKDSPVTVNINHK